MFSAVPCDSYNPGWTVCMCKHSALFYSYSFRAAGLQAHTIGRTSHSVQRPGGQEYEVISHIIQEHSSDDTIIVQDVFSPQRVFQEHSRKDKRIFRQDVIPVTTEDVSH